MGLQLPSDFASSTVSNANGVISALSSPITLIIGVILAVVVLGAIIQAIRH